MDKETEVSPAAHVQKIPQGRQRRKPQTASSSAIMLPNPYKDPPSLGGYQSGLSSTQRSADKGILRRHGYSNNPHAREIGKNIRQKNESPWVPQTKLKAHTGDPKIPGQGRKDLKIKGSGLPDSVTFEVKMDDFPELTGIFVSEGGSPHVQKHCWGPLNPSCLEENLESPWKLNTKGSSTNFGPLKIDVNSGSSKNTLGKCSAAQDSSSGSVTSSWANVASQPPKKSVPKETFKPAQVDGEAPQDEDATIGKKKRKKKKKKAKSTDAYTEPGSEKKLLHSEPPKFEDEDEFPGLRSSFTGTEKLWTRSNTANLCNDENQSQSIQQQPAVQKKDSTPSAKSPFTDTIKAQKAEKVSGKKSKVPVQLDIGNMLAVLEKKQSQKAKQDTKPLTLSVGGGLPVVPKQQPVQKKPWLQDKIAHNPLDSTSPLVKKGKQREVPKAKKPTALKKVILKEREERKQRRLLEERGLLPENESIPAEESAEEDDYERNSADETHSHTDELGDQPELNGTTNRQGEEDEEATQEQTTSTITTSSITTPLNQSKIHSRKFRDYCTQMLSKDVDECVTALLKELVRFQDRLYQKDPMKARMKRRIVMGLREVLKHLKLRKVKCVIISPNCERIQSKGGLDEALHTIIDTCREQGVPFVFALSRKTLGRCVNKAVPVSLVGIFNFDGAQDIYHKMIELSSEAREAYEAMLLTLEQTESETTADEGQPFETDQIQTVSGPDSSQPEEPEYIQLWKKLLEKESNHPFVNFEEQLSSMHLDNEYTEHSNGDGMS